MAGPLSAQRQLVVLHDGGALLPSGLLAVIAYLGMGAVLAVAVAWACSCTPRPLHVQGQEATWKQCLTLSLTYAPQDRRPFLTGHERGYVWRRFGRTSWAVGHRLYGDPTPGARGGIMGGTSPRVWVLEAGWPVRCLRSDSWWSFMMGGHTSGLIKLGTTSLPIRPIPTGIALDTLFFAAILLLARRLLARAFRYCRIRRHLCPLCGYPFGTSPVCTECGRELAT